MLIRLFPKQFDNDYRGHWLALAILGLVLAMRSLMAFNSVFDTLRIATTADGIPVASYPHDAAQMVLNLFALLGAWWLMPVLLGALALIRYRSMVPLIYVFLLLQNFVAKAINAQYPVKEATMSGPPIGSYVVLGILALMLIGLVLSLLDVKKQAK